MKKDFIIKLLVEAVLIFISVLLAFWADSYRESRNEKENYINTLILFRAELYDNVRRFRDTYDSTLDKFRNSEKIPYLLEQRSGLNTMDSLLYDDNKGNDVEAVEMMFWQEPWADWRHQTRLG